MGGWVTDDTFFPYFFLAGFKLGFDKAEDLACFLQQFLDRWQDDFQGDEGHIDDRQIQWFPQILWGDIADIGPFHGHHTRVLADGPGQLTVANIDGEDLGGPLLEQTIGEATGGCAGVATDVAGRVDPEKFQGLFQFQSPTADVGTGGASHLNGYGRLVRHSCLIGLLPVDEHIASHNNGLGLGSGFCEALGHQEHI